MRIGVDVRELLGRPTGVGRYLSSVLGQWAETARMGAFPHQLVLYAPAKREPEHAALLDSLHPEYRVVPGSPGTWWEQVLLPPVARRDKLDVFFAPAYTAPIRMACPVVQTIHDLSFLAHPEWFTVRERLRRSWLTRISARRARLVLTDSLFSADEIRYRLGVPDARIRVIPLGITTPEITTPGVVSWGTHLRETTPGVVIPRPPTFAERRPIVLYVGSIFNRRHVPDLIRAFGQVLETVPDARLEIVGENRTHPAEDLASLARSLAIGDRVVIREYVKDEQLAELYRSARAFAFLSEYEGFGLTPLEALSCGIPVVVLDTPVARETCGVAAHYVKHGDVDELVRHLAKLLSEPETHAEALSQAPAVLARYSWHDAARATLDALEAGGR